MKLHTLMKLHPIRTQIRRVAKLFLICFVAIGFSLVLATTARANTASDSIDITVYRDPSCRCCGGWMEQLAAEGFQPRAIETSELDALKQQYGIPDDLTSCHTAWVDGYLIEGHVPVEDIKRLLTEQPDIAGIAVPGMPIGTPGMEHGNVRDSFTVFSFDDQGNATVFNQYSF